MESLKGDGKKILDSLMEKQQEGRAAKGVLAQLWKDAVRKQNED